MGTLPEGDVQMGQPIPEAGQSRTTVELPDLLQRYAELVVRIGANVRPGQDVYVSALVEQAPVAQAIARAAYVAGARRVLMLYEDRTVSRAEIEYAPAEALGSHYPFEIDRIRELRAREGAWIRLTGTPEPHLFDGLPPGRVSAAQSKEVREESIRAFMGGDVSWTLVAAPSEG